MTPSSGPQKAVSDVAEERIIAVLEPRSLEVEVYQSLEEWAYTKGKPTVLVEAGSGRIVSLSTEARAKGVSKTDTISRAVSKCLPDALLYCISRDGSYDSPVDFHRFREAGVHVRLIASQLMSETQARDVEQYGETVASVQVPLAMTKYDEFWLDLTEMVKYRVKFRTMLMIDEENSDKIVFEGETKRLNGDTLEERILFHSRQERRLYTKHVRERGSIEGFVYDNQEIRMLVAAQLMEELREVLLQETGYVCTVGIGSNKVRAKMAHKLNPLEGVAVLLDCALPRISTTFQLCDIEGFDFNCVEIGNKVADLYGKANIAHIQKISRIKLIKDFGFENAKKIAYALMAYAFCDGDVVVEQKAPAVGFRVTAKLNDKGANESNIRAKLMEVCTTMVSQVAEDEEHNERTPIKFVMSYSGEGFEPMEFILYLQADHYDEEGAAALLEFDAMVLFEACVDQGIKGNANFEEHLPNITALALEAAAFKDMPCFAAEEKDDDDEDTDEPED